MPKSFTEKDHRSGRMQEKLFEGLLLEDLLLCSFNFSQKTNTTCSFLTQPKTDGLFWYLPRRSDHNHHLLQVELVSGEVLDGYFIFNLAVRFPRIVEQLPEVADPGLQQDELRGEPLQDHGHQAVWKTKDGGFALRIYNMSLERPIEENQPNQRQPGNRRSTTKKKINGFMNQHHRRRKGPLRC